MFNSSRMLPNSSIKTIQGNNQQNNNISSEKAILPVKIKSHFNSVPTFVLRMPVRPPTEAISPPVISGNVNSAVSKSTIIPVKLNKSLIITPAKQNSTIVPAKATNLVKISADPGSQIVTTNYNQSGKTLVRLNSPIVTPNYNQFVTTTSVRPSSPIVSANFNKPMTKSARPAKKFNFAECSIENILSEFQFEIIKVLNEPKINVISPLPNIIDIPQHLEVKMKFVTQAEMNKIEMEKRNVALVAKETEMKKAIKVYKNSKHCQVNNFLKIPRCNKSIQCRLLKDVKPEKVKKVKVKENSKCIKLDKSISTADYDSEFESNLVYAPQPENNKLFKYLKDGFCECLKCGKVCTTSAYIKRHVEQHREKGRLCYKCGKLSETTIGCVQHELHCKGVANVDDGTRGPRSRPIQTKDGKLIVFGLKEKTCKYCGRRSKSIIEHLDHVNSHTGEKPHQCTCGARFGHIYNLKFHRKKFGCEIPSTDLFYGMRIVPRNEKRKVESGNSSSTSTAKTKQSRSTRRDPDRYLCKVCNLRCPDYTHFRRHRLKHITERKFVCKNCNNCYKDLAGLKAHIKKKHLFRVCGFCGIKTASDLLLVHMRGHTGEKPYICDICEDTFTCKRLLNKHKCDVHNIGKRLKCFEKSVYKCYLCKANFGSVRSFHNHLIKKNHCEIEKLWKDKCSIFAFNCTYCNTDDLLRFADYAAHAGKTHNMHIYGKMEIIFKAFEQLKNSDGMENTAATEYGEIEGIKIEFNEIEDIKIESSETDDIEKSCSKVENIETEIISNNYNTTVSAQEQEVFEKDTKENVETIRKEFIFEEFMDNLTDNMTQENIINIKFEEMDMLDELFESLPEEEVHKSN